MTEHEFKHAMGAAKTFSEISDQYFWTGYIRGLRRNYHEKFGTDAEHELWMSAASSDDETRRMRGIGYQCGFNGNNIQITLKTLSEERMQVNDLKIRTKMSCNGKG
ncbi:MAG: hypothetical protein ABH870_07490 [bacterium]